MKKSLIFWFAAVTCAAWILVGCESPTNGESGAAGAAGPATLPEDATPELLAAYFASTDKVFLVEVLDEGTFTVPAGKTLAVVGTVDISSVDTVINAFDGTLDVSAGGFTASGKNVFIVAEAAAAAVKAAAPSGIVPAYVASIPADPTAITGDVVLPGLSIGGSGTSAENFLAFAGSAKTVYVAGPLAIDATTTPFNTGSAKLTVLGNTTAAGTLTVGATADLGKLTASGPLTLTDISNVGKLDTATFTVTSADTTVNLDSLDSGTGGKLVLTGNVTLVDIDGGNGNIEFNTGTPAFASTASSFGNTGTTAFTNAAGVSVASTGGITFDGPVSFAGDLTLTNVPATFKSIASFADTKSLKTTAAGSVVTLGPGAALAVAGYQSAWAHILANYGDGNVTLTPSSVETSLTFTKGATANARGITQKPTESGNHSIATTGAVSLVAGSAYTVNSASGSVGTLTVTSGTLSIQDGLLANDDGYDADANNVSAKLVLVSDTGSNGALLTGAGKVVAGNTEISGENGWQAVGAGSSSKIIISVDTIDAQVADGTGDAAGILTAQTTAATITVKNGGTLTVEHGTIDISAASTSFVLEGATAAGSKLLLKGASTAPGKLKVSAESSGVKIGTTTTAANFLITANSEAAATNAVVTKPDGTAIASGDNIVCTAAATDASGGSVLGTIGGGAATKDVLITGPSGENSATFLANSKVKVPNT